MAQDGSPRLGVPSLTPPSGQGWGVVAKALQLVLKFNEENSLLSSLDSNMK